MKSYEAWNKTVYSAASATLVVETGNSDLTVSFYKGRILFGKGGHAMTYHHTMRFRRLER